MMALKTLHTSFSPNDPSAFLPSNPKKQKRPALSLCRCKRGGSSSSDPPPPPPPPEGDARKQELLARMAMLQAQKVRLTDYLDERSAYLTQFGEEAGAEFDKIGEDALRGLDEAGNRIMENVESRMQAFEESMELNRMEVEESENKLAEFEGQVERDRNEGLFFKSLTEKKPVEKAKAKEEAKKIQEVTKQSAGSKTRRSIYVALMGIPAAGIADSFISSSPDWRKVAVLGAILVALITQFAYEQGMLSETEQTEKERSDREDK
ncbi:hypothetical protein BT93_L1710 [Corymbia citriodora subsp. variegata]|uniref:Uncharacterized protein n=1 Tax=Corymbia citriodora subsp. variegata TaxID=360336 RepID=A0A8T0CS21_CORYI|nr:hypothetical protein BT93_L1710 [Corymbia citriodora subsp. variegata]